MDIFLIFAALFAGILTIFAPCVFTLLPVILGSAATNSRQSKPYIVSIAAATSIFLFTLLLHTTSLIFTIDESVWNIGSGAIIVLFGFFTLIPEWWDFISFKLRFGSRANTSLQAASGKQGFWGDVLVGAALGPVFTSCSPVYFLIIATVFPVSIFEGAIYTAFYVLGLGLMLLLVGIQGQRLVQKLQWAVDPHSVFKRVLGITFILVGWSIMFGLHKDIQAFIVEEIPLLNISNIEEQLIDSYESR